LFLAPGLGFGNRALSWIAVVRVSDGRITAATDSSSSNQSPRWSANGRELWYASNALGLPDIYAVALSDEGRAAGPPGRLTVGLNVSTFSLSASNRQIAYAVMTVNANIWSQPWTGRAPPAGSLPTQVTFGQQTIEAFSISHDGKWLFYDSDLAGNPDLYRMPLPAGAPERLTSEPTPEFAPDPSPDGKTVAFHSWRSGSRDIYILPLDGGPTERVTNTPAQEGIAKWSPDGSTLQFMSVEEPRAIFLARRSSNGEWKTTTRLNDGYWTGWSPDGRMLSYAASFAGSPLRVMPTDSGAPRVLYDSLPGMPPAETSSWSEDGRTIYFKSHSTTGAASIWSVPAGGGTPQHLLDLGDARLRSDRYGFGISQGRLYFTLYDRQSNIWVMDVNQ
jgi:Tol biopolymer transport system component